MKTVSLKKVLVALSLAGMSVGVVQAASVTGNASANVLTPLSITEDVAMDFGDVAGDAAGATTVVLTTGGAASSADGAYVGGAPAAGEFTVTGAASVAYTLTLPASITLTSGANSVTVDTLTDTSTGTIGAGGTETFQVGGTLNLGANQAAGSYTGTYAVTVEY